MGRWRGGRGVDMPETRSADRMASSVSQSAANAGLVARDTPSVFAVHMGGFAGSAVAGVSAVAGTVPPSTSAAASAISPARTRAIRIVIPRA